MFNHVRCTYKLVYLYKAYSINTTYYCDKCVQMELFSLENKLYCIQSGVFLTKMDTRYSFLYLLRQIMRERVGKIIARTPCFIHKKTFRLNYICNNDAYYLDYCEENYPLIFC